MTQKLKKPRPPLTIDRPVKPTKPAVLGRPRVFETMIKVRLNNKNRLFLTLLGAGNLSEGVRRAADILEDNPELIMKR